MSEMAAGSDSTLYFRQLPIGPMANFVYLIGDRERRECVVVDPAWDVDQIVAAAEADDMTITGVLVSHYHPDHVGGSVLGFTVPGGVGPLIGRAPGKVHVNRNEADGLKVVTGVSESDLVRHEDRDRVEVGAISIELLHTPGHTPGSQCFLVSDRLVSGDTLFIDGCGRVDLPGGDPAEMRRTLGERLAAIPDRVVLFPGHDYGAVPSATMADQRRSNPYLRR
jgi:hydroxyacylglutathione hydrolase